MRVRELEGLPLLKGMLRGQDPGPVELREGEVRMRVDLLAGQKTGAFLDQRENHLRAAEYARGRCLDCFAYAGGFALQMAPWAERVTAVEMQPVAAAMARENAALNRAANLQVVEANAFGFLHDLSEAALEEIVLDAANDAGRPAQVLERRGAGRDHPVLLGAPETRYLKLLVLRLP